MNRRLLSLAAGLLGMCLPCCRAQQDATTILKGLAEQTEEYQRTLPNFTCNEVVTTKVMRGDKVLKRIEYQADIRVQQKDEKSREEKFWITSYMGTSTPNGGKFDIPIYLEGGLRTGLPSFFNAKEQHCYDYSLSGRRIEFHTRADRNAASCDVPVETTGYGLLDSNNKLVFGEIRRPEKEADKAHEVPLARIDYADVRLDDRIFRMPTHIYGEMVRSGMTGSFEAYYTSCKLYTAKTTIRPGNGTDPPPQP